MNNVARSKINNPNNIELAYDKDNNLIRIKPAEDGLTVKKTKVFAKGFLNYFKIEKKGKFNSMYNEEENALYVNLNKRPAI